MTRNEKYWAERAERRMDAYVLSAEEQARVVRRSYNRTRAYVQSEIEKILHHVGGEDTLAYEYRMKRLTALLQNTEKRIKELYGITVEDTTEFLKSIIPEAYYHTIFDIAKGTGIEPNFAAVNEKLINSIVKEPWSGKNYSKRIWSNMDKLENELRDVLTDAAMNGESIGKTSRKVAESFNTASYNAERLIRTETTYACNQAELASYEELDIDRYKFVATLDTRTSPICQKMDGKVFKTKDAKAGKNLPAMHPNCRSTTIPYFEDFEPEERAARDADGNPIKVPANMTYPEWYDKYVKPKEQNKGPKKPSQPPKGKDTPKKPEPEKTPNATPTEVEIPQPDIKPDYTDTPIPKRPVEVPRPEPTAPAIKPEKKPSNSTKPIDKTVENDIIDVDRKASANKHEPFNVEKYEVKKDLDAVQKAKEFIIDVLGVPVNKVKLDGIMNADVLEPFVKRLRTIQKKNSMKIDSIISMPIVKADPNCVSLYNQAEKVLYISSRFFNSKEALLAALEEWRNDKIMPMQLKNIVFLAEHEAAHIYIPDSLIRGNTIAERIHDARNLLNENDEDIYEFFADAAAIFRTNPDTKDKNILEAIEFLRNGGVII